MPTEIHSQDDLKPGEFYEDAFFHPCVCLRFSYEKDEIEGISLIDGSVPRCASVHHGFVRKLNLAEVAHYRYFGPLDGELDPDMDWTKSVAHDETTERHRLTEKKNQ